MKTFSDAIRRAHKIMDSDWRIESFQLANARRYESMRRKIEWRGILGFIRLMRNAGNVAA